jgi:hypothetical protein
MHEERQDMGKRWRSDMMEATADLISHCLMRGSSDGVVFGQGRVLGVGEDVEQTPGDQGCTRPVCSQLALCEATQRALSSAHSRAVHTNPDYVLALAQCIDCCLDSSHSSVLVSGNMAMEPNLPKASLPDAGRPENLRHLPAHIPARDIVAWEARRGQELVELRDACGHSACPAGVEALECLRRRNGGQSI